MPWEQWGKEGRRVYRFPGRMEVERYLYTPGVQGVEAAKALMEGVIMGSKCGDTIYLPPTTFCPDFTRAELVEVKGPWYVASYTVVRETLEGDRLERPLVVALITAEGVSGGLIHYVDADPDEVDVGVEVEPVFRGRGERRGVITDIIHFRLKR